GAIEGGAGQRAERAGPAEDEDALDDGEGGDYSRSQAARRLERRPRTDELALGQDRRDRGEPRLAERGGELDDDRLIAERENEPPWPLHLHRKLILQDLTDLIPATHRLHPWYGHSRKFFPIDPAPTD